MENTKNRKIKYFIVYTISFFVLFFICFFIYFSKYNKSFFRTCDGLEQHYLIFMNCGKWLREIFRNMFIEHTFTIPLWNNGIGYGADILTSNGAYYPDIFNWISFFFPSKYSELGFNIMIILKFYITGLAFSCFGFHKKQKFWAVYSGTIIYTFSGVMYIAFIQSFFINPMYLLPIVMIGVDRLLKENKPFLYVISLAIVFINYFYFGYMISIFIFIYCMLSFFIDKDIEKNWGSFIKIIGTFLGYSILGIGISLFVLLPIIKVILSASRLELNTYTPLLYSKNWYKSFLTGFINSSNMSGRDAFIGFGAISLPAVICIFLQKKKYLKQKIEFLIITVGLCIPLIGSIMNGFSYYSNRWSFVYALITAYIVTLAFNEFKELSKKQGKIILFITLFYVFVVEILMEQITKPTICTSLLAIICTVILVSSSDLKDTLYKKIYIVLAMVSVVMSSYFAFSKEYGDLTFVEVDKDTSYNQIMNNGGVSLLGNLDKSKWNRYNAYNIGRVRNSSWIYGISGTDFYISIYNNNIDKFHNNLGILTGGSCMDYYDLNKKAELLALMGVNHYIIDKNNPNSLPYGYDTLEYTKDNYEMYASNYRLIYGFDKSISQEEYNVLNFAEKQQVLMQAIVVEEDENDTVGNLDIKNEEINYNINYSENIKLYDNTIKVINTNGDITFTFDKINDAELYFSLMNFEYENGDDINYTINIELYNNNNKINTNGAYFSQFNNKTHMYGGKNKFFINLGKIQDDSVNSLKLTLEPGIYSYDEFKIFAKTEEEILKRIESLNHISSNEKLSTNKVEADLNLNKKQYVFLSIPYSDGWKAFVDGEEKKIIKVDDAFMAIEVTEGEHKLELIYCTPGLKLGLLISSICIVIFSIILYKKYKINKGEKNG